MEDNHTVYNFNPGPAMLPIPVMEIAQKEFRNYQNTKISIMEHSHRAPHFAEVIETAEKLFFKLLSIPENYSVLFFPGGATLQFSCVPLNLLKKGETADYALTGIFAKKAFEEALRFFPVQSIYDGKSNNYTTVPKITDDMLHPESKYLYITSNNTIFGSRYTKFPEVSKYMVADMTSELLSRKIDITKFGLIFAGAQKNLGPAGLTVVIIRNDLLEIAKDPVPTLLDYKVMAKNQSLYNTPPTYSIYMVKLVLEWCVNQGGLESIETANEYKSKLLYDFIDNSKLYTAPVHKDSRSTMNVVIHLKDKNLEKKFLLEAEQDGLVGLAGHRDAGGLRASIYNAMPLSGVQKLISFMHKFEISS